MNADRSVGGPLLSALPGSGAGKKGPSWKTAAVVVGVIVLLLVVLAGLLAVARRQPGAGLPSLPGLSQEEAASEVKPQTEYENPFDRSTQYVNPFEENKSPFNSLQQ